MRVIGSRGNKPSCPHGGLLACYSLDGNIHLVAFSKFILAMENGLCLRRLGFDLVDQSRTILSGKTEQSFKKDGLVFPVRRVGI